MPFKPRGFPIPPVRSLSQLKQSHSELENTMPMPTVQETSQQSSSGNPGISQRQAGGMELGTFHLLLLLTRKINTHTSEHAHLLGIQLNHTGHCESE